MGGECKYEKEIILITLNTLTVTNKFLHDFQHFKLNHVIFLPCSMNSCRTALPVNPSIEWCYLLPICDSFRWDAGQPTSGGEGCTGPGVGGAFRLVSMEARCSAMMVLTEHSRWGRSGVAILEITSYNSNPTSWPVVEASTLVMVLVEDTSMRLLFLWKVLRNICEYIRLRKSVK